MIVIAGVAVLMTVLVSFRPAGSSHPYYFANRAVVCRRLEGWARRQGASARESAEEARRKSQATVGALRERFEGEAERYVEEAVRWGKAADEFSRDAVEALKSSREDGDIPSELPERIRRGLKAEDLLL